MSKTMRITRLAVILSVALSFFYLSASLVSIPVNGQPAAKERDIDDLRLALNGISPPEESVEQSLLNLPRHGSNQTAVAHLLDKHGPFGGHTRIVSDSIFLAEW